MVMHCICLLCSDEVPGAFWLLFSGLTRAPGSRWVMYEYTDTWRPWQPLAAPGAWGAPRAPRLSSSLSPVHAQCISALGTLALGSAHDAGDASDAFESQARDMSRSDPFLCTTATTSSRLGRHRYKPIHGSGCPRGPQAMLGMPSSLTWVTWASGRRALSSKRLNGQSTGAGRQRSPARDVVDVQERRD